MADYKKLIEEGKAVLGIEFGSTRIKAVLIDENHLPIASGGHGWENRLVDGVWTYTMDDVWTGLQDCYADLCKDVKEKYDAEITDLKAIGVSAMMHGYLPFDKDGKLLAEFRTWRNTLAEDGAAALTELFQYNIPARWSIAHLYHAILAKEEHVKDLGFLTTLAGYIHWQLTGEKNLSIGDASGMFPIDSATKQYNEKMLGQFRELIAPCGYAWDIKDILPEIKVAGECAGVLTEAGAKLLDPSGKLKAGIKFCPPEGDAGTGMAATNSVTQRTGNVSAGTSIFLMVVMEENMKNLHREIDMVTTPDGSAVAMVHGNNCTTDLNAWVGLFGEFAKLSNANITTDQLYGILYQEAMKADPDCGGLIAFNYHSGESITGFDEGRPMIVRKPDDKFNLANFMRTNLYGAMAIMRIGVDILREEGVKMDSLLGHGGLFKTKGVAQSLMASALKTPISVMETAGEGGPWGQALLAAYMVNKADGETLPEYLNNKVFAGSEGSTIAPNETDMAGFDTYIATYKTALPAEAAAVSCMR